MSLFCYFGSKRMHEFFEIMPENISENLKFKTLFDNLDESIIIIEQDTKIIEYANNKFF